jgi:hypothetical protein
MGVFLQVINASGVQVAYSQREATGCCMIQTSAQATGASDTDYEARGGHYLFETVYRSMYYYNGYYMSGYSDFYNYGRYEGQVPGPNNVAGFSFYGPGPEIVTYNNLRRLGTTNAQAGRVALNTASIYDMTTQFDGNTRYAEITISPSNSHAQDICGNTPTSTPMIISFDLPGKATSLSTSRSYAKVFTEPPSDSDWFISGWNFQNEQLTSIPKKGEMKVDMIYRTPSPDAAAKIIKLKVAGDLTAGAFETTGTVKVICP